MRGFLPRAGGPGGGPAPSIWGVNGVNYRESINDNMLVIVQIETPVGVANAYDIAMVPGVDVLLGSNGDMTNFSGLAPTNPEYQAMFTRIHDATLKAGKFLGAVTATYAKPGPPGVGRADFADWSFSTVPRSTAIGRRVRSGVLTDPPRSP